ncbi:hypothetical protein PPACK8108_LOCUS1364 [Phakopsora pachyrhizi]|uniref:Uncharacterized protein n=1 Tax=Phakopsora pachyrhizi TaxID=170000 RepID=A0AAV0AIE1_PHAPC|nr:hypothetical protein PPACK8108_LOCUS1364 [Phakopsora pachyrhizi]
MLGYNGIKILVNKALSKVMEQVDGCDLILNKGEKEKTKSKHSSNKEGRLLSNKGLDDDEERLDWVLKVLERYQITLEKVGSQQVAGVHQEAPDFSFADYLFLDVIWLKDVLMVCCGPQIVNWSWVLVRCNPKSRKTSELWKIKRNHLVHQLQDQAYPNALKTGQQITKLQDEERPEFRILMDESAMEVSVGDWGYLKLSTEEAKFLEMRFIIGQSEVWNLTVNAPRGHISFLELMEGMGQRYSTCCAAAEDRARLCELFDGLWKPGGQG